MRHFHKHPSLLYRFLKEERAAMAIEFVLLLPIVLSLIFAIIDYSVMVYTRSKLEITIQSIARDAAVTGSTNQQNRNERINAMLQSGLSNAILFGNNDINASIVEVTPFNSPMDLEQGNSNNTTGNNPFGDQHDIVRYRARYTYNYITPGLSLLDGQENDNENRNSITFVSTAWGFNEGRFLND